MSAAVKRSKPEKPDKASELHIAFRQQLVAFRVEGAVEEYRFLPPRRWRADFAFPDAKVLVDIEGGIWNNGRHVRPAEYQKDLYRSNQAQRAGWLHLRFTEKEINDWTAVDIVKEEVTLRRRVRAVQWAGSEREEKDGEADTM